MSDRRFSRARGWVVPVCIGVAGVGAAIAAASADAVSTHDAIQLVSESLLGSAAVGALAAAILLAGRRARLGTQIAVATLAPVVAVAVGVMWASSSMFLMGHDLNVLWVVLIAAGTVGMVSALLLGRRVARASRQVGLMARRLGEYPVGAGATGARMGSREEAETTEAASSSAPRIAPGELAALEDELRATSARLADARAQSAAHDRARRELVAWVSHDLRTPLAGIRLMIEALEEGLVDDAETVSRYYATMRTESDRLASLVDDLFELSRIQAGTVRLDRRTQPLGPMVEKALQGAFPGAAAKRVELRVVIADEPILAAIDSAAMTRVVRNLVDNAIRHTPSGGTVAVETSLTTGAPRSSAITVVDGCGGIADFELSRVFEPGYRGDPARTPGGGGGLGLAIARGLVEAHEGEITVDNTGTGCRFAIALPVGRDAARSSDGSVLR